ncbi:hypothetical protein [Mycobacterium lepromatosis]|uniref:hypothetical protein n=1 Tax=Mycobacterium lepromatosis TaxID=480418 RepID=UPI000A5BA57C|nr:hypothetical protein [Mycobacterium lepromatosis]
MRVPSGVDRRRPGDPPWAPLQAIGVEGLGLGADSRYAGLTCDVLQSATVGVA